MSGDKLENCPWCGPSAGVAMIVNVAWNQKRSGVARKCSRCGAQGPAVPSEADADETWNALSVSVRSADAMRIELMGSVIGFRSLALNVGQKWSGDAVRHEDRILKLLRSLGVSSAEMQSLQEKGHSESLSTAKVVEAARAALERLGSSDAFVNPGLIEPNGELGTRIQFARDALNAIDAAKTP